MEKLEFSNQSVIVTFIKDEKRLIIKEKKVKLLENQVLDDKYSHYDLLRSNIVNIKYNSNILKEKNEKIKPLIYIGLILLIIATIIIITSQETAVLLIHFIGFLFIIIGICGKDGKNKKNGNLTFTNHFNHEIYHSNYFFDEEQIQQITEFIREKN